MTYLWPEMVRVIAISIHTALAGCDATTVHHIYPAEISIHTALAGCDIAMGLEVFDHYISIHTALAGCDDSFTGQMRSSQQFQSTQPSQAVTYLVCPAIRRPDISIHTALAGCDDSGVDGVI